MRRLLVLTLCLLAVAAGCNQEEVLNISLEDELYRYIADAEINQELFRRNNLLTSEPYILPYSGAVYRDIVDSISRSLTVSFFDGLDLSFGIYKYAEARFADKIYGKQQKDVGGSVTETAFVRTVERKGFYVRLGDNSSPFSGWLLYGYSGGDGVQRSFIVTPQGDTVKGYITDTVQYPNVNTSQVVNFPYMRYDNIPDIIDGSIVALHTQRTNLQNDIVYGQTVTFDSPSGFMTEHLTQSDTNIYYFFDTLETAADNQRLWNFIYIQAFKEEAGGALSFIRGWCIPFRVPQ